MVADRNSHNYAHFQYNEVSFEAAIDAARDSTIDDGIDRSCCKFNIYNNEKLGSGIRLYFWYLKRLILMFLVLFVFSIPSIILCFKSSGVVQEDKSFYYFLFTTTIGRLSFDRDDGGSVVVDLWGVTLDGRQISTILSSLDIFISLIFFLFSLEMMRRMKIISVKMDTSRYSIADYAIEVSGIPPHTNTNQLNAFFDMLYNPDCRNNRFDCSGNNVRVIDVSKKQRIFPESRNPTESCVWEVSLLSSSYGNKLRYYHSYKSLLSNIYHQRRRIQMYLSGSHRNYSQYFDSLRSLSKLLKKRDEAVENNKIQIVDDAPGAIVVFNTELSKYLCLLEFSFYDSFKFSLPCHKYPEHLLFQNEYRLKVKEAVHPTDYNWENFSVGRWSYYCRQCLTFSVTVIVLLISIFLCSYIQLIQNMNNSVLPSDDFCQVQYPGSIDSTYYSPTFEFKVGTAGQHGECRGAYHGKGTSESYNINFMEKISSNYDNWFYISYNTSREDEIINNDNDPCLSPCTSPSTYDSFLCYFGDDCIPSSVKKCSYHVSSILGCYCNKKYINNLSTSSILKLFNDLSNDEICKDFGISYALFTLVSFFAAIIVLIFNLFLYYFFTYLGDFERHKSISDQTNLKIVKLFLGYLLSMAFIILITTSSGFLGRYNSKFLSQIGLFAGVHNDFTPQWYRDVGASIIFTLILGLLTHNLSFLFIRLFIYPCKMCSLKRYPIKTEIINGYTSFEFMIDTSIPYALAIVFVTMIYAGGLPILYLTCLLSLLFQYLIDGYTLYHCKKPLIFKSSIMSFFTYAMPYSILLHLAFTGWMVGYKDLYYHNEDIEIFFDIEKLKKADFLELWTRASRLNCFIYVASFVVLVVLLLVYYVVVIISNKVKGKNKYKFYGLANLDEILTYKCSDVPKNGLSKADIEDGQILLRKVGDNNKCTYHIGHYNCHREEKDVIYKEITTLLGSSTFMDMNDRTHPLYHRLKRVSDYLKSTDIESYRKELIPKYEFVEKLEKDYRNFYLSQSQE